MLLMLKIFCCQTARPNDRNTSLINSKTRPKVKMVEMIAPSVLTAKQE